MQDAYDLLLVDRCPVARVGIGDIFSDLSGLFGGSSSPAPAAAQAPAAAVAPAPSLASQEDATSQAQATSAGKIAQAGIQSGNPIGAIGGLIGGAVTLIGAEIPTVASVFGANKEEKTQDQLTQEQIQQQGQAAQDQVQAAQIAAQQSADFDQAFEGAVPWVAGGLGLSILGLGLAKAFGGRRAA
jgi:hypothetical protein